MKETILDHQQDQNTLKKEQTKEDEWDEDVRMQTSTGEDKVT